MPNVKTNAVLPKGEENGLTAIARELIAEGTGQAPHRLHAVIAIVDCRRVSIDSDTGDENATVRVRRCEVVLSGDMGEAEKLIRRALEFRTGQAVLPLELEEELEATFRDMPDPGSPADPEPPGESEEGGDK
jgi:hypothetical protein